MAYGTVKVDTIIFDQGGADQNVTVSGIYRAITSGVTVSGTISGAVLVGTTTVSGATVTGTTANFVSGVFTTVVSGATVTGTQSSFTSGNFVTLSGATATFTSGVIASGTAAAPSLSIVGDGNTGIYSPGADQVAVATNGTGRLFVDAAGNVGIGASPSGSKLEVNGGSIGAVNAAGTDIKLSFDVTGVVGGAIGFNDSGTTNAYGITDNTAYVGIAQSFPLAFSTAGQERLRITSAGNVGIGTSSPNALLDVRSATAWVGDGTTDAFLQFNQSATAANRWHIGTGSSNALIFYKGTYGTGVETARIDSSGNVGIGTTSPATALNVQASAGEIVRATVSSNTALYANIGADGNGGWFGSNADLSFRPSGTERARIDSSGRLLVGTSSDSGGALLQVNDDRIRVGTAKTPATSGATGTTGEIAWDANYIYVCTATNTWKRSAIATW